MSWAPVVLLACLLSAPRLISGVCTTSTATTCFEEGSVRLVCLRSLGTNFQIDTNAGRLEVCLNSQWGTVSIGTISGFWSEKNTQVACRQLGFAGALNSIPPTQLSATTNYPPTSVPIHYFSVQCDGSETTIVDCPKSLAIGSFDHATDAFIVCWPSDDVYNDLHANVSSTDLVIGSTRLVGDVLNGRGIVEVLTSVGWSTICPDSTWTDRQAAYICQYLGYDSGTAESRLTASENISPRRVTDPVCSTQVQSGGLSRIDGGFCTYDLSNCQSTGFAAVMCSSSSSRPSGTVRLYGLDFIDNDRLEGVVEYFADGRWGVVCRPSSSTEVDESICDGFGYNRDESSLSTLSRTRTQMVESRMKPLWLGQFQCNSLDRRFSDCSPSRPLGYGTCGSTRDILVVDCGPKSRGLNGGAIAGIVIAIVVVIGGIVFLIVKKDEWVPALKRSSFFKSLEECLACKCCPNISFSSPSITRLNVNITPITTAPSRAPAPVPAAAQLSTPAVNVEPEPEPVHEDAELTKPPPPSYTTAFNLPNPKDEQPPPYSAPPPAAYAVPQNNPAYPPGANPAYPPGANPAYPPAAYPPGANPAYPPGANPAYPPVASAPPPPGVATPYPSDAGTTPYPSEGAALPYPTSVADQVYPPPPDTATEYPPATYPQS